MPGDEPSRAVHVNEAVPVSVYRTSPTGPAVHQFSILCLAPCTGCFEQLSRFLCPDTETLTAVATSPGRNTHSGRVLHEWHGRLVQCIEASTATKTVETSELCLPCRWPPSGQALPKRHERHSQCLAPNCREQSDQSPSHSPVDLRFKSHKCHWLHLPSKQCIPV